MNIGNKRKDAMGGFADDKPKRIKKECEYGERCYRRNPAHFREFSHKHLEAILDEYSGTGDYTIPEKYVLERLAIMEQLDVIVEKELYTPWKGKPGCSQGTTPTTLTAFPAQTSQQNNDRNTNNNTLSSRTAYAGGSNNSTDMSSRNDSPNPGSSRAGEMRSAGFSRSAEGSSRSSGVTWNDARDSDNNVGNFDYKKARDYRPVVPPTRRVEDFLTTVRPKGNMLAKHAASAPYHVFYTTISAARETHTQPNSITFLEILDHSLGELKCSLQINFMVDLGWLLAQYYFAGYSEKKLTIVHGEDMSDLRTISEKKPHITAHRVVMSTPFGTHHTKMMILCYEDGSLRVVISTANLYLDDWENRTQGLWFSPACPPLPPAASPQEGESRTQFKGCLLRYLEHYSLQPLDPYLERVRRCDFSHINAFLVASVPGSHEGAEWGMRRAGALLRDHCELGGGERWPVVAQASSLGSFGTRPQLWLTGEFLHNFTRTKYAPRVRTAPPELKLIYPALENVREAHDGLLGGGCLPYAASVHHKQLWLNDFLYQWRAASSGRNRAMPHIKSYTRVSHDNDMAAYYLLTSANVSKAAWGCVNKGDGNLKIMSYEAGVLLLPRFVINKDLFLLTGDSNRLTLAYDVPPTKYEEGMSPWVIDYLQE